MPPDAHRPSIGLSRRKFLGSSAALAAAPLAVHDAEAALPTVHSHETSAVDVDLEINERSYHLSVDARTSLLDAIRDHAGLPGTKKGCDHGQRGACTVLADGKRILSCMTFAVMRQGAKITTIEGLLQPDGSLHPMQQAFIDHDAFQCGYCTPGQIMSAVGCVAEKHANSDADIREYMSGNLCRCAAYPNIVAAVSQAREELKEG